MSAFPKKFLFTFICLLLSFLYFNLFAWAVDIPTLVANRISHDGKTLDLSGLNIGTAGAKQLAKVESLKEITTLHLQGNNIKLSRSYLYS